MSMFKLTTIALVVALVSCNDELVKTDTQTTPAAVATGSVTPSPSIYYAYWVYVMDVRFSRATCATGPGVCFKNGFGDIWDYSFIDNSTDGDVGPIGVALTNNKIHVSFFRSLEEDAFIIDEDVAINSTLARALGKSEIILKAGKYAVDYTNYKFGEAYVTIAAR